MSAWVNIAGTWRKGTIWENVGGAWYKTIPWLNVTGTWRKDPASVPPGLTATANPGSVAGAISRPSGGYAQTNETTVAPTGGVPPYTFAWTSGDSTMTPTAPSAAASRFSAFVEAGDTITDTLSCLVTDAAGTTATAIVAASLSNYGKQSNVPV